MWTVKKGCICLEHSVLATCMISLRDSVDQDDTIRAYTPCVQTVKDAGTVCTGL